MIRKIKFNNFYSFSADQEINFLAKKKKTYDYLQSESNDQITKLAGFVGGNASGKTNIMRLLSFISYFACKSSKEGDYQIVLKTFFNNNRVSNFHIEFEKDNFLFFYDFSVKKDIILSETLSLREMIKGAHRKEVFSRSINNANELNKEFFDDLPEKLLKKIRPDVSFIAFIKSNYDIGVINDVFHYFAMFKTNINEQGEINNLTHEIETLKLYIQDNELMTTMNELIRRFDIGLNSLNINQKVTKGEIDKKEISVSIQGVHKVKTEEKKLNFNYESRGTRSLFFTLANMLSALKNDHVVIIDEIESGLHPEALSKIIGYFIDENESGKAQLLFSSHSLDFMSKLDMHQIFLIEKDNECQSSVYRLNQIESVRTDDNFLAKYMTGVYGAFPKIRI